jgi:hypothetical protein
MGLTDCPTRVYQLSCKRFDVNISYFLLLKISKAIDYTKRSFGMVNGWSNWLSLWELKIDNVSSMALPDSFLLIWLFYPLWSRAVSLSLTRKLENGSLVEQVINTNLTASNVVSLLRILVLYLMVFLLSLKIFS